MKIADLDLETKALIVAAHHAVAFPGERSLSRLREEIARFDIKHAEEREANLINALFGPNGILEESAANAQKSS